MSRTFINMKTHKSILLCVSLLFCLHGCAGTKFSFDDARSVQVGMTASEVQEIMGRPYIITSKDGQEIWVWSYANGVTGASRSVSFVFRDGKVESVPKISDSFK